MVSKSTKNLGLPPGYALETSYFGYNLYGPSGPNSKAFIEEYENETTAQEVAWQHYYRNHVDKPHVTPVVQSTTPMPDAYGDW